MLPLPRSDERERSSRVGGDDVALLLEELDCEFCRGGRFVGPPAEAEHFCKTEQDVGAEARRLGRFAERHGLARERLGLDEAPIESEQLRPDCTPQDLGRDVVCSARRLGSLGKAPRLVASAVSVYGLGELGGTRRDVRAVAHRRERLVARAQGRLGAAEGTLAAAADVAAVTHDRRAELRARLELANVRMFSDPGERSDDVLAAAKEAIPVLEAAGDNR